MKELKKMEFENTINFCGKIHKHIIKNGIEMDKGKFDGLQKGEEIVFAKDKIIGKDADGKCFVKLITGWEMFEQI